MNGADLPHSVEARARREAPMVGRTHELATIAQLIDRARAGRGGVLVIAGEAGLGKTRLLTAATSDVEGFAILRAVGVQSEMRLGFAAVQQLVAPLANRIDSLPHPQARALRAALGLAEEAVSERYLVSLAVLTLITAAAATGPPLLVVVDDVQWLDDESGAALGFLGRRLSADRVCVLLAVREPVEIHRNLDGLPIMPLESLSHHNAITVLEWAAGTELDGDVRERILNDAAGNPLAIEEFALGLTAEQARGDSPLPDLLPVDRRWEVHFGRIVAGLPPPTRELLLTIAAQPQRDDDLPGARAGHWVLTTLRSSPLMRTACCAREPWSTGIPLFEPPSIRTPNPQTEGESTQHSRRHATRSSNPRSGPGTAPQPRSCRTKTSPQSSKAPRSGRPTAAVPRRRQHSLSEPPK